MMRLMLCGLWCGLIGAAAAVMAEEAGKNVPSSPGTATSMVGGVRAETAAQNDLQEQIAALKKQIEQLEKRTTLMCQSGKKQRGEIDRWSPWSSCPPGFSVTGLGRIDLLGSHSIATNHVNDFQCEAQGCRAWCIGSPCTVEARCCRIVQEQETEKP
jgi:hypothetical protein